MGDEQAQLPETSGTIVPPESKRARVNSETTEPNEQVRNGKGDGSIKLIVGQEATPVNGTADSPSLGCNGIMGTFTSTEYSGTDKKVVGGEKGEIHTKKLEEKCSAKRGKRKPDVGLDGNYWNTSVDTSRTRKKLTTFEPTFVMHKKKPKSPKTPKPLTPDQLAKQDAQRLKKQMALKKAREERQTEQELRNKKAQAESEGFQVVPGLYFGSRFAASNEEWLEETKIRHIVNLTSEVKNYFEKKGLDYKRIPIKDTEDAPVSNYFDEVVSHIKGVIAQNEKILVHCHEGRSRAPTFIIAYLVSELGWDADKAFRTVQQLRGLKLTMNDNFRQALINYQEKVRKNTATHTEPQTTAPSTSTSTSTTTQQPAPNSS
ncbi:dual specificity protein phosphatase 9 [Pelomyxa schiedti]|nr:dual specificity protein phosphatase 9 [Pelomyxa schiedti]